MSTYGVHSAVFNLDWFAYFPVSGGFLLSRNQIQKIAKINIVQRNILNTPKIFALPLITVNGPFKIQSHVWII